MVGHRNDIDGLRAAAVIPVVLYHAGVNLLAGGFLGVDVFFVISGYLITSIVQRELDNGTFSLVGFYERRARRILPALFLVLGASVGAGCVILLPDDMTSFAASMGAATLFSSNFWFWRAGDGGYFGEASEFFPLLHTWSLAVEEQFYLLFPFVLMVLSWRARPLVWFWIVIGGIASLAIAIVSVERWPSAGFYLAPTRAWELALGAAVALVPSVVIRPRWQREVLAGAGLIAVLCSYVLYNEQATGMFDGQERISLQFPPALLPCLGTAAVIVAGGAGSSLAGSLLSLRPLVFVGAISYSLYLWHWPILAYLRLRLQTVDLPLFLATAAVGAAFLMAILSWALVERRFRNRAFLTRSTIFSLAGALMLTFIAIAAVIWLAEGFPNRIPARALAVAGATSDRNPRQPECFGVTPPDPLCQLGSTGSRVDFILWGDSHADALFPGVDRAARSAGQTGLFFGMSGCPPLLGIEVLSSRGCHAGNEAVMELLSRRGDVRTVILHARWAMYETGRDSLGDRFLITDDENGNADTRANAAVFRRGLVRTIDALVASGRSVVIVADTPEFEWNVPGLLYNTTRYGDPPPRMLTTSDVATRTAGVNAALAALERHPHVAIVRLAPILCNGRCLTTLNGMPAYSDEDHLTATASRELVAPIIAREVFGQASSGTTGNLREQ